MNKWGTERARTLETHLELYTTIFPDRETPRVWADIVAACKSRGTSIATADAWIAAIATQWNLPLVTADFRDYEGIDGLNVIRIEQPAN